MSSAARWVSSRRACRSPMSHRSSRGVDEARPHGVGRSSMSVSAWVMRATARSGSPPSSAASAASRSRSMWSPLERSAASGRRGPRTRWPARTAGARRHRRGRRARPARHGPTPRRPPVVAVGRGSVRRRSPAGPAGHRRPVAKDRSASGRRPRAAVAARREQVRGRGLGEQRVAEPVGPGPLVDREDVPADDLPQGLVELRGRHPRDGREEPVVGPRAGDRRDPEDRARRV